MEGGGCGWFSRYGRFCSFGRDEVGRRGRRRVVVLSCWDLGGWPEADDARCLHTTREIRRSPKDGATARAVFRQPPTSHIEGNSLPLCGRYVGWLGCRSGCCFAAGGGGFVGSSLLVGELQFVRWVDGGMDGCAVPVGWRSVHEADVNFGGLPPVSEDGRVAVSRSADGVGRVVRAEFVGGAGRPWFRRRAGPPGSRIVGSGVDAYIRSHPLLGVVPSASALAARRRGPPDWFLRLQT